MVAGTLSGSGEGSSLGVVSVKVWQGLELAGWHKVVQSLATQHKVMQSAPRHGEPIGVQGRQVTSLADESEARVEACHVSG